ncbi:membrane protein DedA, SNARE-associated domain [Gracilibacillus ureilyticus]|uniref:Membrane protein DedA, SNARE-associated domain n=1 Tax=Gracilibacillus ureilyticus TaxID=531814 RepID=A0A1H9NCT9_9BACI|nr:DedA family protein [Gracilibacillus ureilyticus]SER33708.1 membrane protein DedA, SNARE-associated domain [Gracilibacillus ureilyticus]
MENLITNIMEEYGYWGIFFMMAVENIFPPIPSEIVLPFSGFMTTYSSLTIVGVITASTFGSVVGAIALYGIGLLLKVNKLEKIIDRWGHILRISNKDLAKADEWFAKYGYWTILFCRMIPLVRSLISIPAGMAKMNIWIFLVFTIIGTVIWNIILIMTGAMLGENWEHISSWMDTYSNVAYLCIFIGLIATVVIYYKKKK